ncbi:DUF2188 domain-containing protein [Lacicoccus alkaliphilus]|uniref:Uncharacterized protein YdaT n=1 Tax=Lacicoccus alkaliphilus DSM 16010 TaxID=1123231 RepID=A0A1M7J6U3_9BACL|nr:DUF2188 domain-containing protein [Salinicoccus alkaliphilus]SHM48870.1 Uncharacterized protein YdaT [Salinicoccus alkaliphilus DSM 16010]
MAYTMNDYPDSLKNLDRLERRKAIDIINAMLEEGYDEGRAIPIGTEQAQEWYKDASEEDLKKLENKDLKDHDDDNSRGPDLIDNDVEVYFEDDEWKVKTVGAKQASDTYDKKDEAEKRAKEIADKRSTKVKIHNKND